jgi:LysM repeat protein
MHDCTDGEIGVLEQDIPFTFELNMPDMNPDMKCDVTFRIEDIYDEIKEDENGDKKNVDCEVVIDINAKAYSKREIENVIDAYSPEQRYEMEKQTVKAISFFGEGAESEAIKERITLPNDAKPLNKIKNMIVKPIITDTKVVEDKVVVEGIANCCIIYTVALEEGGIISYEEDIPFKSMIDIPGTKIDMTADVDINVCDIGFEAASDKNIDVKMIVHSAAKVYSKDSCDIAKGALEAELPDSIKNMPSIVIYSVQNKDTLWKIAKKYSTTVDDIVTLNNIENQDNLEIGNKLLIPKKLFMK